MSLAGSGVDLPTIEHREAIWYELQQEMMQLGQAAYNEPQGQPSGGNNGKGDEGVVEGEYTVE